MTLKKGGGGGELGDYREIILKKSKSEPFLLLEHPPTPLPTPSLFQLSIPKVQEPT